MATRYGDSAHPLGGTRYGNAEYAPLADTPTLIGPDTMQSGQPAVFTVLHMDPITSATISGIDVSASIDQTGDQLTITVPDMFEAGLRPRAHLVVVGDGTDTAQDDVDLVAPDDWTQITLNGYATIIETAWTRTLDAEVSSIADDDVFELIDGDVVWYFNDGVNDLVVNEDGTYNLDEQFAPLTIGRIAYFPDSQDPEAGPDGIYSVMGDYTIAEQGDPPQGTITFPAVTPGVTSVSIEYAYDLEDADSFEYRVDSGTPVTITENPFTVTGLDPETQYNAGYIQARAVNQYGESEWFNGPQFTTEAVPTGVVSFDGPNIEDFDSEQVDQPLTPLDVSVRFSDSLEEALTFSPVGTWPTGVTVTSAGVIQGTPTEDGEFTPLAVRATNESLDSEDSNAFAITVAPVPLFPPAGTITFDSVTPGVNSVDVEFSYSEEDADGFEYRVDGGSPQEVTENPFTVSGLDPDTPYALGYVQVRAVNEDGGSAWFDVPEFATEAEPVDPPAGTITIDDVDPRARSASVSYTYDAEDATGFQYRVNGGNPIDVGVLNPFLVSGLTPETTYLAGDVEMRAINSGGEGTWTALPQFVTLEAPAFGNIPLFLSMFRGSRPCRRL